MSKQSLIEELSKIVAPGGTQDAIIKAVNDHYTDGGCAEAKVNEAEKVAEAEANAEAVDKADNAGADVDQDANKAA